MNTIKSFLINRLSAILLLLVVALLGCNDPTQNDIKTGNELLETGEIWYDLIEQTDVNPGIIVDSDASIQAAIDIASAGDVIYVAPGIYHENISINKSVRLVGLHNASSGPVILENPGSYRNIDISKGVEITNIQLRNYNMNTPEISDNSGSRKIKRRYLMNMTREEIGGGIAHYKFDVRMGEGEFDIATLHRVVKERNPYHPVKTSGDIFMVHGASQDFEDIFYVAGTEVINAETSAPFYLASQNIDVWGIDLAWTNVPIETTDFGFMEGWGVEKDIDHTLMGINIARIVRGITGQSFKKMNLLGFSYGVAVAYGAAGRETQKFHICRNVKGIIPVDSQLKVEDLELQDIRCFQAGDILSTINTGNYCFPQGAGFIGVGQMVMADPNGPSPAPGLTNIQFLNYLGSDHGGGTHFMGGTPFELFYSDSFRFMRLAVDLAPYMPYQTVYEFNASGCPSLDVSFDDYIGDIKIPILNISAEGGSGHLGDYTSTFTKTVDYTLLNVDDPTKEPALDFGHADLWMADQAAVWVWEPLLNWLNEH